jgi:hypothetical protein
MTSADETVKQIADAASVVTAVGTIAGVLPAMAALFTIIWTGIRIYETETIQKMLEKPKDEDG